MSDSKIYPVPEEFAAQANINAAQYDEMYRQSVEDPEGFWSEQAENYLSWFKPWNSVCDWSFDEQDLHINWFAGGELNVSYNCLDRHLETRADQVAIIWEGDDPDRKTKVTAAYQNAVDEWSRLVSKYPNTEESSLALFRMAQVEEENLGDLDQAL